MVRCCRWRRAPATNDHSAPVRTGTSSLSSLNTLRSSSSRPITRHLPPAAGSNLRRSDASALLFWLFTVPQLTPSSCAISDSDSPS